MNTLINETFPKMEILIKKSKEMKINLEKSLSQKYDGRNVRILEMNL